MKLNANHETHAMYFTIKVGNWQI